MEYARNFMEYLNQKRNIPFEVHAFSSAEMFLEFAKNNETEILLISDKAMKEEIRRYPIRQIIILSEGVHSPVLDQYPAVYKYQSSEKVIREVMACYGVENGVDTSPALLPKKEMRIIGIYSPVGRTQKTSFALTMGQILAKERAVLYLNMESYSGFERLLECSYDRGNERYSVLCETGKSGHHLQTGRNGPVDAEPGLSAARRIADGHSDCKI